MVHFVAVRGADARRQLLDRATDYVGEHGIGDLSLRTMAAALGTSHRMLIHHFGSKEGLWVAIAQAVEARQREVLARVLAGGAEQPGEAMREWWRHISDRSLWPNERLFFELYGQALHGRSHAADLLDGVVDSWVDPVAELLVAAGVPAAAARAHARLGVAATRGLLLDLLATGDAAGVDAAMEAFIDLMVGWLDRATGSTTPPSGRRGSGSSHPQR
jgi:AcrR family transcriptional regulator